MESEVISALLGEVMEFLRKSICVRVHVRAGLRELERVFKLALWE